MTSEKKLPYLDVGKYGSPDPGCVVEIGSERGAGSTHYLREYANNHSLPFYTVDVDPSIANFVGGVNARGLDFLEGLELSISVAYLDGFDWTYDQNSLIAKQQRIDYSNFGMELTNENCQQEHLLEAEVVVAKASPKCLVVIDDTYQKAILPENPPYPYHEDENGIWWTGKGGKAVPYFVSQGYRVMNRLDTEEHAVLLKEETVEQEIFDYWH